MRRAVVHCLPETRRVRRVQAVGIEADKSSSADVITEGQNTVVDGILYLGCREVPHRPGAVTNATFAPLTVDGPAVVALVEVTVDARDAAVRPHIRAAAVRNNIRGIGSAAVAALARLDMGLVGAGVSNFVVCPPCASAGLTRSAADTPLRRCAGERGFYSPATVLVVEDCLVVLGTERDIVNINYLCTGGLSRRWRQKAERQQSQRRSSCVRDYFGFEVVHKLLNGRAMVFNTGSRARLKTVTILSRLSQAQIFTKCDISLSLMKKIRSPVRCRLLRMCWLFRRLLANLLVRFFLEIRIVRIDFRLSIHSRLSCGVNDRR